MAKGDGSSKKIALVVGNSAYRYVRTLDNPKNDAAAIAKALQELAFDEIVSAIDLSQKDLLSRLQEFYAKLDRESTALLFYAGHGVQVWGQNYLLPCDAQVAKASDLRSTAIPLNDVVRAMSRRASTRLLFLDACRNDPLSNQAGGLERGVRSVPAIGSDFDDVGRGLAKVTATAGTFVAYATEPGNVALDGTGKNSPFTTALSKHIAQPGLGVDDIMMQVRVDVLDATEGKQLPWSESALTRRFQFREGQAQSVSRDFEQEYWDRVKDTDNPDFLESFLRQFPNGRHAEAAHSRIGGVRARKEAADWDAARSTDTIAALADFARRYPTSKKCGHGSVAAFRQAGASWHDNSWRGRWRCDRCQRSGGGYHSAGLVGWQAICARRLDYGNRKRSSEAARTPRLQLAGRIRAIDCVRSGAMERPHSLRREAPQAHCLGSCRNWRSRDHYSVWPLSARSVVAHCSRDRRRRGTDKVTGKHNSGSEEGSAVSQ